MAKYICEKASECDDNHCVDRKPHDHDDWCERGCDSNLSQFPEAKCVMVNPSGVELIAEERKRQIEQEGWDTKHDDSEHDNGGLALAGTVYAIDVIRRIGDKYLCYPPLKHAISDLSYSGWPWDMKYWKPTPDDPIRQLVKAGALIAAEIDRLQRMKKNESST